MTTCDMCGENVAAIFKPTIAVCKPCHRAAERQAIDDYPIENAPYCATCSTLLNRSGVCPECVTRSLRDTRVPA